MIVVDKKDVIFCESIKKLCHFYMFLKFTKFFKGSRTRGDYWDLDELLAAIYVIGDENRSRC